MASAVEEAARHQVVFREVNERMASLTGMASETGVNLYICECSDLGCAEVVEATAAEYEGVRADAARFLVKPGHQLAGIERVVAGNGRFLVVEKVGEAGQVAEQDDPRTA